MSAEAYNYGMRRRESFFRITEEDSPATDSPSSSPFSTKPMNGVRANSSMTRDAEQVRRMMDAAKAGNEARIDWSARMTDEQIAELSDDNPAKPRVAEGPSLQRESIPFPDLGTPFQPSPRQEVAAVNPPADPPVSAPGPVATVVIEEAATEVASEVSADMPPTSETVMQEIVAEEEVVLEPIQHAAEPMLQVAQPAEALPQPVAPPTLSSAPLEHLAAAESLSEIPSEPESVAASAAIPRTIDPSQFRRAEDHIVAQATADVVEKTAKNGHQEITTPFPTAAQQGYQPLTPVEQAKTAIGEKKQESLFIGRPKRERKRIGKVALSTVVALGALTGLGLYAGGADLLSTWFVHRQEGAETASRAVPPAVAAPSTLQPTTPAPQLGQTAAIEVRSSDTGTLASSEAGGSVASDTVAATLVAAPVRPTEAPAVAEPRAESQPPQKPAADTTPVVAESSTGASMVVVQVRATPDPVEAKRIARKLRKTGITTVSVMEADNHSTALHRVRFEFAGSKKEAIAAAERAGYSDVWVVKQK